MPSGFKESVQKEGIGEASYAERPVKRMIVASCCSFGGFTTLSRQSLP